MNEQEIFSAALEQGPDRLPAFLELVCGADAELRQRVDNLLRCNERGGAFFEMPAAEILATAQSSPVTETSGALIGPYKLLEQIGEGGMGLVYMAEQQQPVRRLVALKLVKPGMDTKQVIARFEAERQALAMMDHPNIAKVHDAGTTETGRPYFVMELVRGIPINEFCDQQKLTVRQRLALFIQICQAIQHAHQKGIIHRDLKPTNVLVTKADTVPLPKVIDFGIAKALGPSLTDHTLHTGFAQLVGTPMYMSPEQAEMNHFGVDTRSDVYSLGVLLYELLTGTTPFDKERLKNAGFDEMRRIIREEEPETVSARIAKTRRVGQGRDSGRRPTDSRDGGPALAGSLVPPYNELDWIVMKALEKDRSRRYESASALAADIQRYLSDEPVLACPPTTMYRFQKFARKHKPALATAAAIAVCLVLGTTVSAWQAVRATTAEGQAKEAAAGEAEQRQRAEANEQKAVANAAAAQEKEREAITQRDEVKALADKLAAKDQQLQRTLYAAHMNLARHAWTEAALPRLHELLEQHRPKADQNDLRGFEWHYLNRLSHAELMTLEGDAKGVYSVACSKDGKLVAGSCSDKTVRIWDAKTGRQLHALTGHTQQVNRVVFSPDSKRLASASGDGTVKVWDVETGKELLSLQGRGDRVGYLMDVDFSPDGTRVAAAAYGGNGVTIWNAQTGEQVLSIFPNAGWRLTFSPDGEQLATTGRFIGELKIWNAKTGALIRNIATDGPVDSLAYSPDGQRLATRLQSKTVKIWDVHTRKELLALEGHTGTVRCVAFSPDGKRVATGGEDRLVKVWDAQTGRELFTLKGHPGNVFGVAFLPGGERLVSGGGNGAPIIWDIIKAPGPSTISGGESTFTAVAISPDGAHIAGGAELPMVKEPIAKVWDAHTGKERFTIEGHGGEARAVAFSPDGKRLASVNVYRRGQPGVRAEVKLWEVQTGRELLKIPAPGLNGRPSLNSQGTDVVFSPDGKRLFACGGTGETEWFEGPGEVKGWDAETGAEVMSLKHDKYVGHLAISADGKLLAGWAFRAGIKIWDLQNGGQEVLQIKDKGGTDEFGPLAFSPDGKRLVAHDKVWDVTTGKELLELKGHSSWLTGLAYSTDGKRLATASQDQTVKIWDAETGDELLTLEGHEGWSNGVAFTANGKFLAAGGPDGTIKIYDATPLTEKP